MCSLCGQGTCCVQLCSVGVCGNSLCSTVGPESLCAWEMCVPGSPPSVEVTEAGDGNGPCPHGLSL